jgi:hypothetical protein
MSEEHKILKNWHDTRKIEAYCVRFGLSHEHILALMNIHALYSHDDHKDLDHQDVLDSIAQSSLHDHKKILKNFGQENNRKLLNSFLKLSQDKFFAGKIIETYHTEIKPNLKF